MTNRQQDLRKRDKHLVDMSPPDGLERPDPQWIPPPDDECEEATYQMPLGADGHDRVVVRMVTHTNRLVRFALIQETRGGVGWNKVMMIDSSHNDDVHTHYYAKSTGDREGDPESLMTLATVADVQRGYDLAYPLIVDNWAKNKERWTNA